MHRRILLILLVITAGLCLLPLVGTAAGAAPVPPRTLKVGVTLHPYYSWTANVVGTLPGVEVRPILPGEIDAGDYQPRPEDIKKIADLDAIVVNGIGHDDFIFPMIKASGNKKIVIVRPNAETPQIRSVHGNAVNSHTFISFTNAIQQTYAIEKALAQLRPDLAAGFQKNAADYARRLGETGSRLPILFISAHEDVDSRVTGQALQKGAIAFFRCGDANLGEFTEDVLIRTFGNVPNNMSDL